MAPRKQAEIHETTQPVRRAPRETVPILAAFDGTGDIGNDIRLAPVELTIEATGDESETAAWLTDEWWTEGILRWEDCPVTVHFAPTPGALLHPIVLHQLQMLSRVMPHWRLVGHAYVGDVTGKDAISELAKSPYDEVRFIDEPRPGATKSDRCSRDLPVERLFGLIRAEQSRAGSSTPILVRLPSAGADAGPAPKRDSQAKNELPASSDRFTAAK